MAQDNVGEIKSRLNIVEVISKYVSLKKQGNKYIGLCPFHSERTPSFNVDPQKQFYKCFGCGESGDIFSFIQKKENLSFGEALELLAKAAGVTLEKRHTEQNKTSEKELILRANAVAQRYFSDSLKTAEPEVLSYVARRGIDSEMQAAFGLGWAPDAWDGLLGYLEKNRITRETALKAGLLSQNERGKTYDRFRGRLMFPIYNILDRPIAFGGRIISDNKELPKYINSQETPVFSKGKEFYALNLAHKEISAKNYAIIVEGYMDVIACHSAGVQNAVALLGTALTEDHIRKLARYTRNVTLCLDADAAGIKSALRSGEMLLGAGFRVSCAALPPGEDPDSLIRSGGAARFLDFIQNSPGLLEFEIQNALKDFDLDTREGRLDALNAAIAIIAREPNVVRRDALIGDVAYLHPRFNSGVDAEGQIRKEVDRRVSAPTLQEAVTAGKTYARSKSQRAQELLLGGVCNGTFTLDEVFEELKPEDFQKGFFRNMAEILMAHYQARDSITFETLTEEVAARDMAKAFYTMLADTEGLTGSAPELIEIIRRGNIDNLAQRKKELTDKLQKGELTASDPEYRELLELMQSKSFRSK